MQRQPAKTTLANLQNDGTGGWVWAHCAAGCGHYVPLAIAPFVILWGPYGSSDLMRDRLRCSQCGRLGADLKAPSWVGSHLGVQLFPVGKRRIESVSPW